MKQFPKLKDKDFEFLTESVQNNELLFSHKLDGTACIMEIIPDGVILTGRGMLKDGTQQAYTGKFPDISVHQGYQNCKLQCTLLGEIVTYDDKGEDNFALLQPRLTRKKDIEKYATEFPAKFIAFDILELNGRNLKLFPLYYRLEILEIAGKQLDINTALQAYTVDTKQHMIDMMIEHDWEGIVVKDKTSIYGEKSYKHKQTHTEDVFNEGEYVEGKGKYIGMIGSLIVYQYINGIKVHVANVRGFTDEQCRKFTDDIATGIISEDNPLVLEVKSYQRIKKSNKLRHPTLLKIRSDKAAEQCIYEP